MTDIEKLLQELEKEVQRVNNEENAAVDDEKVEEIEEPEEEETEENKKIEEHKEEKSNKKRKKGIKIVLYSLIILLAIGGIKFILSRESKKGKVRFISNQPTSSMTGSKDSEGTSTDKNNLVVETTAKETKLVEPLPVETTAKETKLVEPLPVETTVMETEPVETTVEENKYEFTQNDFEDLVSIYVKNNGDKLSSVSTEDIVKFVAIANMDEIVEKNPELAHNLYNLNSSEEYLNDCFKVIGATVMYDFNVWNQTNSTKDFVKVSDIIVGSQKEKMIKIENYVNEIADAVNANDEDLVNEIVAKFLTDMNSGELSKLDDGVGLVSQIYVAVIGDGVARNYLNQENFDGLQELKDSSKYTANIFAVYEECSRNGRSR